MSSKYIGNSADLGQGIYTVQDVQEKIKTDSWPVKYNIENSLRFEGGSYLSKTPTTAGTSHTTFTYSFWVKKSVNSTSDIQNLFEAKLDGNDYLVIFFQMTDEINIHSYHTSKTGEIISTAKYKDNSSWYHIIFTCDTTNSNGNDRYKLFVNGDRVLDLSSNINPTVNYSTYVNTLNQHRIGLGQATSQKFYGYMANIHFIDGQALDPSHFAYTNPVTNKWVPKAYKGTYGTNGFHLEFKNTGTHTGVGGIGEDTSGNGNHWAVSNFTADDVVPDSPTNSFATLNSLDQGENTGTVTLSEGNLKFATSGGHNRRLGNIATAKKFYVEYLCNANGGPSNVHSIGFRQTSNPTGSINDCSLYFNNYSNGSHNNRVNGVNTTVVPAPAEYVYTGDVIGMCFDPDTGCGWYSINGDWKQNGNPSTSTNPIFKNVPADDWTVYSFNASNTGTFNFGQDPTFANTKVPSKVYTDSNGYGKFYYEPPAGALALCEANINQPENTVSEYVVDETGNHMLTYNGGVGISKFSPYAPDGYSIAFAGNSQQLKFATSADFELTGDATVEMWVYLNSAVTGNTPLYGYGNDAGSNYFSLHIAADGRLQWYQHGSLSGIESTASVGIRRWHHIALVKDGTSLKVYNNGKEVISSSYTASFPTGHELRIGSWYNSTNYGSNGHLNGYIADYRVVKGTAVYQGDFTPPTNLTAITNTKLLLSTSSKQIVDISASPKTIIFNGPPSISDWTPFIPKPDAGFRRVEDYGGGSSFYFDGSSNLKTIDSTDWNPEGQDFTVEGWYYLKQTGAFYFMWGTGGSDGNEDFAMRVNTNNTILAYLRNSAGTLSTFASTSTIVKNTWNHIALERYNNIVKIYLNGVAETNTFDATSWTGYNSETGMSVGAFGDYTGGNWNGYIADFRIVKGSAIYQGNFTPPTAKLTAVTNTKYLLQPWHTKPARSSVYEISDSYKNDETGKSLTYVGYTNITQSSPYKNINFGSIESSTNNNSYISLENNSDFNFGTGPFTMETWIKRSGDTSSTRMIFNRSDRSGNNMNNNEYAWFITSTEMQVHYPGVVSISGGSDLSNVNNTDWMHVVWERVDTNAGGVHFYVNGVKTSSHQYGFNLDSTRNFEIGGASTGGRGVGFYSDIRIVKGQALYGGTNFIPPAYPLSATHYTTDGTDPATSSTKQVITGTVALLTQPGKTSTVNVAAKKPEKHFNTLLYSGNGGTQNITGLDFQPDLVWIKPRSLAYQHQWYDSVRGALKRIGSSLTNNENTETQTLTSFTSSGFTVGNDGGVNASSSTNVAWCWKAGGTPSGDGVAMVDGSATTTSALKDAAGASITPTRMSVNTKAGFSIVKYTGITVSNVQDTIPHGLNNTPEFIIIKDLDNTTNWRVYHKDIAVNETLYLNLPNADAAGSDIIYSPNTNTITLGNGTSDGGGVARNNTAHICYAWHSVAGFSAFGSYTGNGSTTGTEPFVYTGFKPAWLIIKRSDTTNDGWYIYDNARSPYNVVTGGIRANSPNQEDGSQACDFLSNGFRIRIGANGNFNATNGTYIYAAFAEQPFTRTNAR